MYESLRNIEGQHFKRSVVTYCIIWLISSCPDVKGVNFTFLQHLKKFQFIIMKHDCETWQTDVGFLFVR